MKKKWRIAAGVTCITIVVSGVIYHKLSVYDDKKVTFVPYETKDVLLNPYVGFAPTAKYRGTSQSFRLVHANLTWRELEPVQGQYAFDEIEKTIQFDKWKENGVKIILRVILDDPGTRSHMDIPDWLYEETDRKGTWYDVSYGKGFSPDYMNPELISYHKKLIEALGNRYNSDPTIAFIQLGSLGHWGEWHTWEGEGKIPFPKRSISNQYAEPYVMAFPDKKLMMRRPHEIAVQAGMGLFNDAFGREDATVDGFLRWYTEGYKSWLTKEDEPAMPDFWVKAPSGGEFADETAYVEDSRIDETIRQAKLTHVSYLGPNVPFRDEVWAKYQSNIDRFLNTIGYRYVITRETHSEEVRAGQTLSIELNVINRGVAPIYYVWPLELSLSGSDGRVAAAVKAPVDIRTWLPGENSVTVPFTVPANLPSGDYTVNAGILDPETGKPGVLFANSGKREDGRYSLGTVQVTGNDK